MRATPIHRTRFPFPSITNYAFSRASAAHLLRVVLVELGVRRGDQLLQLGREDGVERRARLRGSEQAKSTAMTASSLLIGCPSEKETVTLFIAERSRRSGA